MRFISAMALSVLCVATLTGCDDPKAQVQLHKPGKYLGPVDPLLEKSASGVNDKALKDRFTQFQRDR